MKELVFVPSAGLCNRMNAMVCALAAARVCGYELTIYWPVDKDCRADFEDLFEPLDFPGVTLRRLKAPYLLPDVRRYFGVPGLLRKFHLHPDRFTGVYEGTDTHTREARELLPDSSGRVYVTSFNRFCQISEEMERLIETEFSPSAVFRPAAKLRKCLENVTALFRRPTLGIHIRRTDNKAAISTSKTEEYIERIDRAISDGKAGSLFIASDSEEEISILKKRYGERIIAPEGRVLSRTSREGMEQAVIDLWSLASTDEILGSAASTYSIMAASLGGIPLKIIGK